MSGPAPHDLDVERAILGAFMFDAKAAASSVNGLTAETFYKASHRVVFNAVQALLRAGTPVTETTVKGHLAQTGLLEQVGGMPGIMEISAAAETPSAAAAHAEILEQLRRARTLQTAGIEAAKLAKAGDEGAARRIMAEALDGSSGGEADQLDTWRPVDLSAAVRGDKARPAPTILRRSDGKALFYEGQINYLHGADGTGKSFVALFAAIGVLHDDGHVVWLDWEDPDETTVVSRLRDLCVDPEVIAGRFHYIHPETEATPAAVEAVSALIRDVGALLVVIDSVGEAFGAEGIDEDRDNEVTPWMRRIFRPLAATGAAVLPIDHVPKNASDGLQPSGSKRKRAQVTGAHYLVEAKRPISQENEGGELLLTTAKDRHGNFTRGKLAGRVEVAIYPDGGWTFHVHPPRTSADAEDKALHVAARAAVRAAKEYQDETGKAPSLKVLEESMNVRARRETKRAAIDLARDHGALREEAGARGARTFVYVQDLKADQ